MNSSGRVFFDTRHSISLVYGSVGSGSPGLGTVCKIDRRQQSNKPHADWALRARAAANAAVLMVIMSLTSAVECCGCCGSKHFAAGAQ